MGNKKLTVFISLFLVIIIAITVVLFINVLRKNKSDNEVESVTSENTVQTDDKVQENNVQTPKPADSTEKESNESPQTSNASEKPIKNDDESNKTSQSYNNNSGASNDQPQTGYTAGSSYKDFTLTAGMSAKEAYEFLDDFLSSKYSILVNKQNKVSSDYTPSNLVTVSGSEYRMENVAASALERMMRDASLAGYKDLVFYSGYRTYASQKNKFETRTNKYLSQGMSQAEAEKKAGEYIAPPGSSEHHTGLAADVCSSSIVAQYGALSDEFDKTSAWKWLNSHCAEYGFILRYRKESEDITGFLYEPWHFRYIGEQHAKCCTGLGMTYESYHAMLEKFRSQAKEDAGV